MEKSMDTIKQIPHLMSKVLTKIFNLMVQNQKFPECLKTARVLPLRKAGKCRLNGKSYRPISIMNPMEKLLEETKKQPHYKAITDQTGLGGRCKLG